VSYRQILTQLFNNSFHKVLGQTVSIRTRLLF